MPWDALPVVLLCGLVIAVLALAVAYAMAAQQARWDREDDNTADASLARVDASVAAKVRYPQGFLWGVATAPIQNEGHNPWTTWSQWAATDRVADAPLQTCNAWKTFESVDVPAAAWLGCNAFRLGVDWGRVEPQEGKFNHTALRRYRGMLLALREAGMEPVLTLCHFALPNWAPGWEAGEAMAARFGRFVRVVLQHMGDLVRWFITLNEPQIDAVNTHLRGERWPGKTCVWATVRAMRGMWLSHNEAARAIRAAVPDAHISIAKNYVLARPASTRNPADLAMAALVDAIYNNHFIKACVSGHFSLLGSTAKGDAGSLTFLGLNHYNHVSVHGLSADVRMESGAPEGLTFRAPPWDGKCGLHPYSQPCLRRGKGSDCPSWSLRQAQQTATTRTGQTSWQGSSMGWQTPRQQVCPCWDTCIGRCLTHGSGARDMRHDLACLPPISRRSERQGDRARAVRGCEPTASPHAGRHTSFAGSHTRHAE